MQTTTGISLTTKIEQSNHKIHTKQLTSKARSDDASRLKTSNTIDKS